MIITEDKRVLVSGASFAGLATAYWMNRLGYRVTVVEVAGELKKGGTPVNIKGNTINVMKRMGLFEQVFANRLTMQQLEFKNAADETVGGMQLVPGGFDPEEEEYEIERNVLLHLLYDAVKNDVEFVFGDSIATMYERPDAVQVSFKNGPPRTFGLVIGCDGLHSAVRRTWFGPEADYTHFMQAYFAICIVDKLLIKEFTTQMYNEPGRGVMLHAYNGKTDIVLCYHQEREVAYDYRDQAQQRKMIADNFAANGWRTAELLEELNSADNFYFDKLCQVKMPRWTKGRVALVGDAGYCASPAAGMGGSLAIDGAAALAEAFEKHPSDHEAAFAHYNQSFRPFLEQVQEGAITFGLQMLVPTTQEAINKRNAGMGF